MRAGSVTMVFSFCRTTGSGSLSRIVLPYDFDILRPSVPGNFGSRCQQRLRLGKDELTMWIANAFLHLARIELVEPPGHLARQLNVRPPGLRQQERNSPW